MKKTKLMFSLAVITALSSLFFGITGCEKDGDTGSDLDAYFAANPYISDPRNFSTSSDNTTLTVTPSTAAATAIGQKINFVVTAGDTPLTWAVANGNGTIAAQADTRYGIYTVSTIGENNIIVSDVSGKAAIADITLYVSSLSITPSSGYVTPLPTAGTYTNNVSFTAVGGVAPFSWSLVYGSLGTLSGSSGSTVTYTATTGSSTNIQNAINLIDSKGTLATATITHHN